MLLAMRGITKDFPAGRVLHGIDLSVPAGHVHALVGENGAGKSTLMKVLGGVYPDYGGTVMLDDVVVDMASPRTSLQAGVALIHQEFALVPDFTVAQNIALGRESRGRVPGTVDRRKTLERSEAEALDLGIELDLEAPVRLLPVDQQQLVEIVKAVARDARVLVMDEPTARLTSSARDRLFEIIAKLKRRGVGIVYISHFLEEIVAVAGTVTVLRDGRVVGDRSVSETSVTGLVELMVGTKGSAALAAHRIERVLSPAAAAAPPALEVCDLTCPGRLSPTNLTIRPGEILALAGLPSSGRASLARAMVGEEPTATGAIKLAEWDRGLPKNPHSASEAGVSMLPADRKNDGVLGGRSVADNIALSALGSRLSRMGLVRRSAKRRLVTEMIESLGVRLSSPDQPMILLSGGNQQKVLLARAMAAQPAVLVLDQPTVGVDVQAKAELYAQIDALATDGTAVLLISDDIEEILRLAHTVCVVRGPVVWPAVPSLGITRARLLAAITTGADLQEATPSYSVNATLQSTDRAIREWEWER